MDDSARHSRNLTGKRSARDRRKAGGTSSTAARATTCSRGGRRRCLCRRQYRRPGGRAQRRRLRHGLHQCQLHHRLERRAAWGERLHHHLRDQPHRQRDRQRADRQQWRQHPRRRRRRRRHERPGRRRYLCRRKAATSCRDRRGGSIVYTLVDTVGSNVERGRRQRLPHLAINLTADGTTRSSE